MKRRHLALALGAVAVAVTGTLVVTHPADAATNVTFSPRTVLAPGVPKPDSGKKIEQNVVPVGKIALNMTATQTAYVVSVMRVNAATGRSLFDNEVVCHGPGGWSKNMVIGQNAYERNTGNPQWEDVTLTTRYLLHPGVAGTVTCTANIRSASLGYDDENIRLVGGSLRFADQSIANTTAGKPIQASVPVGVRAVNATNRTVRQPALDYFTLAPGSTGLSVFGDTEFMVCWPTKPCNTRGATTARFTLIINQWKSDGTLCQTDGRTTVTKTVPYPVHHIYVPLHKPKFAIKTGNGCIPRFNAYVRVDWLSGQTGGVQGTAAGLPDSRGSTKKHNSDMSHIFAVPY